MKKIVLMALALYIAQAKEPMLRETAYKYVKSSIGKGMPHFVEMGSDSCHSCQVMGRTLYKVHKQNPTYNMSFVNVKKERQAAFDMKIRMIPTQLIFDKKGKEVYRHVGVLSASKLMGVLKKYKF